MNYFPEVQIFLNSESLALAEIFRFRNLRSQQPKTHVSNISHNDYVGNLLSLKYNGNYGHNKCYHH